MSVSSTPTTIPAHGNYHGYYTKRPFLSDTRLAALPSELFHGARVLDVGCNEGWVTCEIAQTRGACFVVGVDIDATLIQAAWRRRIAVWSAQAPTQPRNVQDLPGSGLASYFPASCEHELGSLPIPPSENRGKDAFPHNISFRTADWTTASIPEDEEGYDVVIGFSVSKWIHLNNGDEGLKHFFQKVYDVLRPGGKFVLEPQPWESYAKAKRMSDKLKENGRNLTLRPADFESILTAMGFEHVQHYGFVGDGGFSRPLDLYIKGLVASHQSSSM